MTTPRQRGSPGDLTAVVIAARTLQVYRVTCRQLMSRGADIARHLGYERIGIKRGSAAAHGMSVETRHHDGFLPSMKNGGLTAALQSVGATGVINEFVRSTIAREMMRAGMLEGGAVLMAPDSSGPLVLVERPSYFSAAPLQGSTRSSLVDDYRSDGYNIKRAEEMLARCVHPQCTGAGGCGLLSRGSFKLLKMQRIENPSKFEAHKKYEAQVAEAMPRRQVSEVPSADSWLQRLALKNGLCQVSKTRYLLHGTKRRNLGAICDDGLLTGLALQSDELSYGKGSYFTDSSCKAQQYTDDDNGHLVILVCRVVLGQVELLQGPCSPRIFPSPGFDSCFAKSGHTNSVHGRKQLHHEYIVHTDPACYPEFVLTYQKC